jgi:hypothetical protein
MLQKEKKVNYFYHMSRFSHDRKRLILLDDAKFRTNEFGTNSAGASHETVRLLYFLFEKHSLSYVIKGKKFWYGTQHAWSEPTCQILV